MFPPDRVLAGALRWLDLLQRNSVAQAWSIVSSDSRYSDLTTTQYHTALEWLRAAGFVLHESDSDLLAARMRGLAPVDSALTLMARALELEPPTWLSEVDEFVFTADDMPDDAVELGDALGLDAVHAAQAVRRAMRKVDLEARARIGSFGEARLIALLEQQWPGSTTQVSVNDDTAGYDISFRRDSIAWHLEVKATVRRGRLEIYLSRHEYEVGLHDNAWRLVVVGITDRGELTALATVPSRILRERAPHETHPGTNWESAHYVLSRADLSAGLCLDEQSPLVSVETDPLTVWAPAQARQAGSAT